MSSPVLTSIKKTRKSKSRNNAIKNSRLENWRGAVKSNECALNESLPAL